MKNSLRIITILHNIYAKHANNYLIKTQHRLKHQKPRTRSVIPAKRIFSDYDSSQNEKEKDFENTKFRRIVRDLCDMQSEAENDDSVEDENDDSDADENDCDSADSTENEESFSDSKTKPCNGVFYRENPEIIKYLAFNDVILDERGNIITKKIGLTSFLFFISDMFFSYFFGLHFEKIVFFLKKKWMEIVHFLLIVQTVFLEERRAVMPVVH